MAYRDNGVHRLAACASIVIVGIGFPVGVTPAGQAVGVEPPIRQAANETRPGLRPSDIIGSLDFYGLRTVPQPQARKALSYLQH